MCNFFQGVPILSGWQSRNWQSFLSILIIGGRILCGGILPFILVGCKSQVFLNSTPKGAEVYTAEGGFLGKTDLEKTYPRKGQLVSFVFRKDGYREARITERMDRSVILAGIHLERRETRLEVLTKPTDASITLYFDGRKLRFSDTETQQGVFRMDRQSIWEGNDESEIELQVTAPVHEEDREIVNLRMGEHRYIYVSLTPLGQPVELSFDSDPKGAAVYENSLGFLGRTPFKRQYTHQEFVRISHRRDQSEQLSGQLTVVFKHSERDPVEKTFSVQFDKSNEVIRHTWEK